MKSQKLELADIVAYLIVIAMLIWAVFPLYWIVITAFKPLDEFMTYPPTFWPSQWTLDNFTESLVRQHGAPAIVDSVVIAIGSRVRGQGSGARGQGMRFYRCACLPSRALATGVRSSRSAGFVQGVQGAGPGV